MVRSGFASVGGFRSLSEHRRANRLFILIGMDTVDEVFIVGVEEDCDCLCLGEDKTSKQKRLRDKVDKTSSRKGKEPADPSRRSVDRKSTPLSSSQSSELAAETQTRLKRAESTSQTGTDRDGTNTGGQAKDHETPAAMQFQPADHGSLSGPSLSQQVARGASASHGSTSAAHQSEQYGAFVGLRADQDPNRGGMMPMGDASSGYLFDFNTVDWMSASEWDSILGRDTSCLGGLSLPSTSQTQKETTVNTSQGSAMCSSSTGNSSKTVFDSSALVQTTPTASNSFSQNSLDSSNSSSAMDTISTTKATSLSNFTTFEATERDSACRSVHRDSNSLSFPVCNVTSPNCISPSTTTTYPSNSLSTTAPPAAWNQDQTPALFNPSPTASSTSLSPLHSSASLASTAVLTDQSQTPPQAPLNSHGQQNYHASQPANLPNQYQPLATASPLPSALQQQQQQHQPASSLEGQLVMSPPSQPNTFFPNSLAPVSMPQMANSQVMPSFAAAAVGVPQDPRFTNQRRFSVDLGGPAAAWRQSMVQPQYSYNGGGFSASPRGNEHLDNDESLARKLQEEEFIKGMRRSKHGDERLAMSLLANDLAIERARNGVRDFATVPNSRRYPPLQSPVPQMVPQGNFSSSLSLPTNTNTNTQHAESGSVLSGANSLLDGEKPSQEVQSGADGNSITKHPTCWTECPDCPPDATRKYHLINVEQGSPEWDVVSKPLVEAGFSVIQLQRIQNETLWQRLCFEKQLMLRDRPSYNQKFLYHTSKAEVSVICEEGLDPRLSRNGLFGSGIYFR